MYPKLPQKEQRQQYNTLSKERRKELYEKSKLHSSSVANMEKKTKENTGTFLPLIGDLATVASNITQNEEIKSIAQIISQTFGGKGLQNTAKSRSIVQGIVRGMRVKN